MVLYCVTSEKYKQKSNGAKGRLSLFNLFIDMRTTVSLSISCRKNLFLVKNFNKNTFSLYEMDKLTVVLMSIKRWLNKKRWPLTVKKFYLKVRGHASEDMKMDSVMSSKTWRRNSALAQASVVDSILFGFNSQDWWRDSMILKNQNK